MTGTCIYGLTEKYKQKSADFKLDLGVKIRHETMYQNLKKFLMVKPTTQSVCTGTNPSV